MITVRGTLALPPPPLPRKSDLQGLLLWPFNLALFFFLGGGAVKVKTLDKKQEERRPHAYLCLVHLNQLRMSVHLV